MPTSSRKRGEKLSAVQREAMKQQAYDLSGRGQGLAAIAAVLKIDRHTAGALLKEAIAERRPEISQDEYEDARILSVQEKNAIIEAAWMDHALARPGSQTRSFFLKNVLEASVAKDRILGLIIERRNTVDDKGQLTNAVADLEALLNQTLTVVVEQRTVEDNAEFEG